MSRTTGATGRSGRFRAGLSVLRLIVGIAVAAIPVALAATFALDPRLVAPLALVWLWMALMTAEFFAPQWLKARPFLYLVSHMLIMPLIDLFVTACEWLTASGHPPGALWLFLVLSFLNGCVLEIGRKIYRRAANGPAWRPIPLLLGSAPGNVVVVRDRCCGLRLPAWCRRGVRQLARVGRRRSCRRPGASGLLELRVALRALARRAGADAISTRCPGCGC